MPIIVHCADLHLNRYHPHQPDPAFTVFKRIIDFTNRIGADLLLIAGDLYDSVFVSEELIHAVQQSLARCNAKVFICGGNHDYCAAFSPLMKSGYSTNVHILPAGVITDIPLPQYGMVLHGYSFDAPHQSHSPLLGFRAANDGLFHIGLFHANLSAVSEYAPITEQEIADSRLDYLALGHCHSHRRITCGSTTVCYPGTPQPRRFEENGGILAFEVDQGRMRFLHSEEVLELDVLHHQTVSVDLSGCSSDLQAAAILQNQLQSVSEPQHTRMLIILKGETAQRYRPNLAELREICGGGIMELQLNNQTFPGLDTDGEDAFSLQGIFLSKLEALEQNTADATEKEIIALAKKYGIQAFYGEVMSDAD